MLFSQWGFDKTMGHDRGTTVLLYGPPGTGKTMACEAIAFSMVSISPLSPLLSHISISSFPHSSTFSSLISQSILLFPEIICTLVLAFSLLALPFNSLSPICIV